jgi:hypothetical protein
MRRSAWNRAFDVMTRPTVHRRSQIDLDKTDTLFKGFLGLSCARDRPPVPTNPPRPATFAATRRHDDAVRTSNRAFSVGWGRRSKPPCLDRATSAVVSRSRRWWGSFEPMLSCQAVCAHVHSGLLLADHAPQYARCARRPLPAMARSRSSSPAAKRRHSSRGNKIAQPAILR